MFSGHIGSLRSQPTLLFVSAFSVLSRPPATDGFSNRCLAVIRLPSAAYLRRIWYFCSFYGLDNHRSVYDFLRFTSPILVGSLFRFRFGFSSVLGKRLQVWRSFSSTVCFGNGLFIQTMWISVCFGCSVDFGFWLNAASSWLKAARVVLPRFRVCFLGQVLGPIGFFFLLFLIRELYSLCSLINWVCLISKTLSYLLDFSNK
jgi:hypothetical protein